MPATEAFLSWSGWVFGLAGFIVSMDAVRRAVRERRRSDRMAGVLSTWAGSVPAARSVSKVVRFNEEAVRSFLVHAAAGGQPLSVALMRAQRVGASDNDVLAVAEDLHHSGLLDYRGRLVPETILSLRQ